MPKLPRFRMKTALIVMGALAVLAAWYADHARLVQEIERLELEVERLELEIEAKKGGIQFVY
jgi:hypothetical protein